MARTPYRTDLTDPQWNELAPLIPPAKPGGRPRAVDMREVINGIRYVLRTAAARGITCPTTCRVLQDVLVLLQSVQRRRHVARHRRGVAPAGPRAQRPRPQPRRGHRRRAKREDDEKRGPVGTVGFDAGKRVKGRKRHVAVDSLGLPLA